MSLTAWYDVEVDILAIKVEEASMVDEDLLDNDILIGYDEKGRVIYDRKPRPLGRGGGHDGYLCYLLLAHCVRSDLLYRAGGFISL